jgi:response regulator RpfG family c-di-GMP phosphodiesterase
MQASILIVDDEQEVLNALQRVLRKDYQLYLFSNPLEALEFIKKTHVQLIISDMNMPLMSGVEFLQQAYAISPLTKRIVLTGHADVDAAKNVVNQGGISGYYSKPWHNDEIRQGISTLILEYISEQKKRNQITALRKNHQQLTLKQSSISYVVDSMLEQQQESQEKIKSLRAHNCELIEFSTRLIGLLAQDDTGHNYRVAQQAKCLAQRLGLKLNRIRNIYISGLLYQVGLHHLPEEMRDIPIEKMSFNQKILWEGFVTTSADIVSGIALFKSSASVIAYLHEHVDGSGLLHKKQEDIPLEAQLLSVIIYYDLLLQGKVTGVRLSPNEADEKIKPLLGKTLDAKLFRLFKEMLENPASDVFDIGISVGDLKPDMMIANDIFNHLNHKLLSENSVVSQNTIDGLKNYESDHKNSLLIYVKSVVE